MSSPQYGHRTRFGCIMGTLVGVGVALTKVGDGSGLFAAACASTKSANGLNSSSACGSGTFVGVGVALTKGGAASAACASIKFAGGRSSSGCIPGTLVGV